MRQLQTACVAFLVAVALAGCASTSGAASTQDCLDATRSVTGFEVESPTSVRVTLAPSRAYRVTLEQPCSDLGRAAGVGFANGPARLIGRGSDGQPLWANSVSGSPRICGRPGDQLTIRETFSRFDMPAPSCRIDRIERL